MDDQICYIKISRDNEIKENFYIEYSFNGIHSRKRFWITTDKEMKKYNKEVITNILRNTVLEITSNKNFWNNFSDILSSSDKKNLKKSHKPTEN